MFYALARPDKTLGVIDLAGTGLRWGLAAGRPAPAASSAERGGAELAQLQHQLAGGDTAVTDRFQRLTWTTDFADRRHARVLDHRPLYHFPRSEHVFRAASDSYKRLLDSGVEDRVRHLDMPVLVMHGAQDTDPARARRVAELAPKGRWAEFEHGALPVAGRALGLPRP
jgi:pimeloyl-ACP methyl ester carboxylesterase